MVVVLVVVTGVGDGEGISIGLGDGNGVGDPLGDGNGVGLGVCAKAVPAKQTEKNNPVPNLNNLFLNINTYNLPRILMSVFQIET